MTEQLPEAAAPEEPQAPATDAPPAAQQDPPSDAKPEPPESKPTETVEFWKQKAREQESRAKSNADAAKKLKEIEDRDLSELDKAKRDAEQATAQLAKFEQTTIRQRVALEKGLPASLVSRLQGSTEDEVSADADVLMAQLKSPASPQPDPGQGARPISPDQAAQAEYEKYYPPATPRT